MYLTTAQCFVPWCERTRFDLTKPAAGSRRAEAVLTADEFERPVAADKLKGDDPGRGGGRTAGAGGYQCGEGRGGGEVKKAGMFPRPQLISP